MTDANKQSPADVRALFEHFDLDNNGIIDREEFNNVLAALDAPKAVVDAGLAALDENGNGKIELDEFMSWWAEQ